MFHAYISLRDFNSVQMLIMRNFTLATEIEQKKLHKDLFIVSKFE